MYILINIHPTGCRGDFVTGGRGQQWSAGRPGGGSLAIAFDGVVIKVLKRSDPFLAVMALPIWPLYSYPLAQLTNNQNKNS